MCTIAFLQGPAGHFILAGNRDEARTRRRALPPVRRAHPRGLMAYPVDADAGGTWMGANTAGMAATLLNGYQADAARTPRGPTRSRGALVPQVLTHATQQEALEALLGTQDTLGDVRPFVLACAQADASGDLKGWHAHWDGHALQVHPFERRLVLVSSGVHLERVTQARTQALSALKWSPHTQAIVEAFAQDHAGAPSFDSVCMARPDARSVSHTCVEVSPRSTTLSYLDGPPSSDPTRHVVLLERAP